MSMSRRDAGGPEERETSATEWRAPSNESKLQQIVLQVLVRILLAHHAAALQLGHQAIAHFDDVAPVEVAVEDQEAVAAHLLHDLGHHAGDMVGGAGEVDAG